MDKNLKLAPFGVAGELCVSGVGVGRGYLNRPELSREKFVQNPYKPGERLYRSGDLVRLTTDKEMEYLGRIDYQVKIRGFRIELGEIESQLLNHPIVKEVVVILMVDDSGDKQLCAYIVCEETPNTTELKEFLAKKLPDYMIPSYMVTLDKIPLTPNGKVDKKALPGPKAAAKETYTAPRNLLEKRLVEIWSEVLGVEYPLIGINSNFFELGGHSLKATVLLGRLHQEFNIKIPLGEFFKNPTIKELAHYGQSSVKDEYVALGRVEKREFYALSASQKHMFILSQFIEYNMPTAMVIEGKLDRELFERVMQKMVNRHESLRTSFEIIEGEPVQRIYDEIDFEIECDEVPRPQGTPLSIRGAPQGIPEEPGVLTSIIENFFRPFDLSQPPLIRVGLIKLPGDFTDQEKYLLLVNIHHVVSDGITVGILAREFMSLYEGKTLPELKIQYKDFSQWEQEFFKTEVFKEQEKYWLNEFTGEIPVLNMPTDFPRPVKQSFAGGRVSFGIEGETFQALKTLATKQAASLYMLFMTVYNTVLFRYTGQEDIIVGTITAGREEVDVKDLAGIFINTLAARNYPGENKTFNEFLKEVKTVILNAFRNQRYPFGELLDRVDVKKNLSRTPLFDVMLIWQNMDIPELEVKGLSFFPYDFETVQIEHLVHAQHDMTLWVIQGEAALRFDLEYCTKLFKKETMERFARHFLSLLKEIVKDPETRLGDIDMMGEEEKKQVLVDFNNTDKAFPVDVTIVELFEKLVERIPDHVAAVGPGQVKNRTYMTYMTCLSYKELNDKSNQLAHVLQEKGVQPDTIVAMMMERCPEMFIGILAILKAGGVYLPLDPGYPQARIDFMLNDSNARIILKKSEIRNPKSETNPNDLNSNDQNKRAGDTVLDFEHLNFEFLTGRPRRGLSNFEFRASNLSSSNLAYLIYTSGSTGRPKGVMVNHGNFLNAGFAWRKEYQLDEIRVNLLQVAGFSFDVFAGDFARVFINGGKSVICPEDTRMDPPSLYTLIRQQHITLFESTPSLVIPFMEYVYEHQLKIDNLQLLIVGSDSCPVEDFKKLILRFGNQMRIINSYGVTEATIDTSYYEEWINDIPSSGNVPIGKPMPNMKFFILDTHENLQPVGIPGELSIGGDGVARGYLNNPELTAERFLSVSHRSYRSYISKKIYKTGDLARWLPDGNMEFLGRMDFQVKVRGYRIELKEIENQLKKYRGIKETVVLAPTGNLCAYIVFAGEGVPVSEIREYLSGELPDYMIPTHFIEAKQIPLTPNGKIDKKALSELDRTIGIGTEYVAPTNEVEKNLAAMWSEILEKDRVGIDDNFFDLGGQSLIAMRLMSMIKEVFNVKVPLTAFFQVSTVKAIAGLILETQSREGPGKGAAQEDHSFASVKFKKKKRREREI
jgi:amino acid adenylation domain-containing protein